MRVGTGNQGTRQFLTRASGDARVLPPFFVRFLYAKPLQAVVSSPSIAVAFIAALLFFPALGSAPLWDRDEPRNAQCTSEMLDRGDWVVPYFNGELRTHKPVLLYWLMMGSYALVGRNEWGARLPSAVLSLCTVLLTYHFARCRLGERVGRWSAVVLATSLLFTMASRAATPDAALIFFSTLALCTLAGICQPLDHGVSAESSQSTTMRWLLLGFASGMAVLAKGPLGLVLPAAVGVAFVGYQWLQAWRGQDAFPRISLRTGVVALGVAVVVSCPWYCWVALRTDGVWIREFLTEHNLSRAMHSLEGHRGGVFYYPLSLLVGFFPWSILTIPLLLDLFRCRREERSPVRYLLVWIMTVLLGFSVAQTKLPSYLLPAYPAVAIVLAWHLERWSRGIVMVANKWMTIGLATMVFVATVHLIALPWSLPEQVPYAISMAFIGVIPLAVGLLAIGLVRAISTRSALVCIAAAAFGINAALFSLSVPAVGSVQRIKELLAKIPTGTLAPRAAYGHLEPSWVFYGRQSIREIGIEQPARAVAFLESNPGSVLIVAEPHLAELAPKLRNYEILVAIPEFLKSHRLLAIQLGEPLCNEKAIASPRLNF